MPLHHPAAQVEPQLTAQRARARIGRSFDLYVLLLWGAILLYIIIFSQLAFDLHNNMRTHRSDLGQIAQAVWNSSQGRFVEMTDNGFVATRMTDHVEPILALISPVLWLWRDVRTLLFLQVVAVAVGAWPLYALAIRRLDLLLTVRERSQIWQIEPLRQMTRPLALVLAITYLLVPHLQSSLLTEFHAVPLAVPLLLWAFWALDAGRHWQFALATLLVAATKEEMALLAAGLAFWALWRQWLATIQRHERPLNGPAIVTWGVPAALLLLALLWFYLATFVIVPAHAGQVYTTEQSVYFERYGALGSSPLDIARTFFVQPQLVWQIATEPARVAYLWQLLRPFGWFTLLAPEILLLALPLLLANLLSAYPAQYYGEFHYSAPLVPYVAVSALFGLARLWRWSGRYTARASASYQHLAAAGTGTMALVSLLTNARTALRPLIALALALWLLAWGSVAYIDGGRGPAGGRYDPVIATTAARAHVQHLPHFLAQIPPDAAVTATAAVHPHLSLRRYVYQFPLGLPELGYAGNAEWALLDVTTNTDMAPGDVKVVVDRMLMGEWGIVDGADGFLLLRRGAPAKAIPTAFYDFARIGESVRGSADQLPNQAPITTQIVRVAADDWPRWRQTKLQVEWLVGSDVQNGVNSDADSAVDSAVASAGFVPDLTVVTPDGERLHDLTSAAPPALVWYPPERWLPGERVQITTLPLLLPRFWGVVTTNAIAASEFPAVMGQITGDEQPQQLLAAFQRTSAGLQRLPLATAAQPPSQFTLLNPVAVQLLPAATVDEPPVPEQEVLRLRAWGNPAHLWPGGKLLLWLRWQGEQWPAGKTAFVHLRVDGENVAQRDGLPRQFVYYAVATRLAALGEIDDSRVIDIPAALAVGTEVTLVVGLYDVASGERALVLNPRGELVGDEWAVATWTVGDAPVPDQACALVPQSCAAQATGW